MSRKKYLLIGGACCLIIGLNGNIFWGSHANIINNNIFPISNFTYSPEYPTDLETIQFNDSSQDPDGWIVTRIWDFGDGNSSIKKDPHHQYRDDGEYVVSLTVIDNNRTATSTSKTILIRNVPPVADCGPDKIVNTSFVLFDASLSYDLDGVIMNYTWQFNETAVGYGKMVTHEYESDGLYNITLWISDDDNDTDNESCSMLVDTNAPATTHTINGENHANNWYHTGIQIHLNATDETSGIKETKYRLDNSIWYKYQDCFNISLQGEHVFTYYSIDNALNNEEGKAIPIKIDTTDPRFTILQPEENYLYIFNREINKLSRSTIILGRILVEINAEDSESGIERVDFYVNNHLVHIDATAPYKWPWDQPIIGPCEFMCVVINKAGRQSYGTLPIMGFIL